MKPTHAAMSIFLVFVVAIASTVTGMMVGKRAERVAALQKQIKSDYNRIQILRTEVAYLASPQRIQALVNVHRPDLHTPEARQYLLTARDALPTPAPGPQNAPRLTQRAHPSEIAPAARMPNLFSKSPPPLLHTANLKQDPEPQGLTPVRFLTEDEIVGDQ